MAMTVTLEDLQKNAGAIVQQVQHTKDPVYISLDGWAPVMLVNADDYLNQQQAYREMERIFVAGIPGVPLPETARQPQSTAAIDNHALNASEPDRHPLYPTTTEAQKNSLYYNNLADNGDPIEPQTELLKDELGEE